MIVDVILIALAVVPLGWTSYLGFLALLSGENPVPSRAGAPTLRFDVIVPAHNEEIGIAATVQSLLAVEYPAELRRVVVVADNCQDATAIRAREAGAIVLERTDTSRRGKGYALEFAFERTLREGIADAVAIIDADTTVTPNLLAAFGARLSRGAVAVQAEYAVANKTASWRTRLMHIALTLFHDVRSRARERLGVSAGLRGNGMSFATRLLKEIPHDAFSIVEDVEYGIRLGLAGYRVEYAGEAHVFGQMVSTEAASRSQRRRWEGGRGALARAHAPKLILMGLRRRSLLLLDLAADLLVPPLTYVVFAVGLGAVVAAGWWAFSPLHTTGMRSWWPLAVWGAALGELAAYVLRGIWLARVGPRVVLDLLWAPVYMIWKVVLALRSSPSKNPEWVRTTREGEKP
jgi:1,2-diacylglycerol 3-beta-glucosyltransferase